VISGELPFGLTLDHGGLISGTPKAEVLLSVQVFVQDNSLPTPEWAAEWLTIVIKPAGNLLITTTQLPPAKQHVEYKSELAATGGTPPYGWSVISGTLPAGIQLDDKTGALAGKPSMPAVASCRFEVTDTAGKHATRTLVLTVVAECEITTKALPEATAQRPYDTKLQVSGGVPPYSWAVTTGTLPAGIQLEPASGRLFGTPQNPGTYPVSFTVLDSESSRAISIPMSLVITPLACLAKINYFTIHTDVIVPERSGVITVAWSTEGAATISFDTQVGLFADPGPSGSIPIHYQDSRVGPVNLPPLPTTITCVDKYGVSVSQDIKTV
jgi:hypothetical protein